MSKLIVSLLCASFAGVGVYKSVPHLLQWRYETIKNKPPFKKPHKLVPGRVYSGKEFNRMTRDQIFFKVLREDLTSLFRKQYQIGLNCNELRDVGWGVRGGMCVTNFQNLHERTGHGTRIAIVTIPDDAHVIVDKFNDGVFQTDKLIITEAERVCEHPIFKDPFVVENLKKNHPHLYSFYMDRWSCEAGHTEYKNGTGFHCVDPLSWRAFEEFRTEIKKPSFDTCLFWWKEGAIWPLNEVAKPWHLFILNHFIAKKPCMVQQQDMDC
jgi:hypothetical protein